MGRQRFGGKRRLEWLEWTAEKAIGRLDDDDDDDDDDGDDGDGADGDDSDGGGDGDDGGGDGDDGDNGDDGLGQPISGLLESRPPKSSAGSTGGSKNQFPFLQNVDQQKPVAPFREEIQTLPILRERDLTFAG